MVERLKNRQQSLIRWRWVGLIGALVYIGAGCYGLASVIHFLHEPDITSVLIIACMLPVAYGLVALGVGLAAYLFLRWNGKPETNLLLRLIEDSQNDAS